MSAAALPASLRRPWAAVCLAALAGCAGTPQRDGPPASPPSGLQELPDAEPRVEAIRVGGPNKPYEVLGQQYTPLASDEPVVQTGLASWYGRKFHGQPTASGEIYDMYAMTAAHRTMPIPSYALVRNPANGREVVVRINDRGPFHRDRIIDLSYTAALKLGVLHGVSVVEVQRLTHADIRSGRWRSAPARAEAAVAEAGAAPPPTPRPAAAATAVAAAGEAAAANAGTADAVPAAVRPDAAPAVAARADAALRAAPSGTATAPAAGAVVASASAAAPGYWLQLGAFRQLEGAFDLRRLLTQDLAWLEPLLAVFDDQQLFRVQAGPYATRREAQRAAARVSGSVAVQPLIVQRH